MAAKKSERLINLTICLLAARRFVSKEQLREIIDGYREANDTNFERMFERDKDELRSLGIPIEVGKNSELFDDEVGYLIRAEQFALPPLEFTCEEATAVALASRMWTEATMAEHTASALAKLQAGGIEPDTQRLTLLAPACGGLDAGGAALTPIRKALAERRTAVFNYRGESRQLQPWLLRSRRGAWYVYGFDLARQAPRMFRLNRIDGGVKVSGAENSYTIPDAEIVKETVDRLSPKPATDKAVIAVRKKTADSLRQRGELVAREIAEGFEAIAVDMSSISLLSAEIASLGDSAYVIEPPELVAAVVELLKESIR
ncbi:MAG: helix-turn-helix transcriptional regulator [Propionibacteriaceae bacterium]